MVTRKCGADGKWIAEPFGARFSQMLPFLETFRIPPTLNGTTLNTDELIAAKGAYADRLQYSNYDDCLPTVTKALLGAPEYAAEFNMVRAVLIDYKLEKRACTVLLLRIVLALLLVCLFDVSKKTRQNKKTNLDFRLVK